MLLLECKTLYNIIYYRIVYVLGTYKARDLKINTTQRYLPSLASQCFFSVLLLRVLEQGGKQLCPISNLSKRGNNFLLLHREANFGDGAWAVW